MSKFSYLKELLIVKVCLLIDSLLFTSEGYTRAKYILMSKYFKPSENANTHVQNIMSITQVNNTNPKKNNDFSASIRCNGKNKRDEWVCESYTG